MSSEGATIDHETTAAAAAVSAIDQTVALATAAPEEHHVVARVKVEDPLANLEAEGDTGVDREQAALDAGEEAAAAAMEAAAAAEAAEACLGSVLDDVAGVVAPHRPAAPSHPEPTPIVAGHGGEHHEPAPVPTPADAGEAGGTAAEDDDVALAAAAAAAAVQAADGMAVVVDQALLATAAAAAASQVAEVLGDHTPADHGMHVPTGGAPPPLPDAMAVATQQMLASRSQTPPVKQGDEGDLLHHRREKDRKRYSAMTPEARASYNAHRRELYHKQGESARKRRRERERDRYHALEGEAKKERNKRRAKLERDRYNRLSKGELAGRNAKRRERAKQRKMQAKAVPAQVPAEEAAAIAATTIPPPPQPTGIEIKAGMAADREAGEMPNLPDNMAGEPLPEPTVDVADAHAMADASALAAEVAEQVIAGTNLEGAMEAVAVGVPPQAAVHGVMDEDGPTVQI